MKRIVLLVTFVIILGVSALFFLNIRKDDEEIKKENNEEKQVEEKEDYSIKNSEVEVYSNLKLDDIIIMNDEFILRENPIIDTNSLGNKKYLLRYCHRDRDDCREEEIIIKIVDTIAPYIGVGDHYSHIINTNFTIDKDVICADNYDKFVKCELTGEYDLNALGEYPMKYTAVDSSNNKTEKDFILRVIEKPVDDNNLTKISDLTIPDNASILIDVSKWQKDIDWKKVKEAGVNYAMIRLGTQKAIDEDSVMDEYFEKNIKEAQANGIKVGVYYFSYANDIEDAKKQAGWVIDNLKDYKIDLPVSFDWECWKYFNGFNISLHDLNEIAETFLKEIESAGYTGANYGSKNYLVNVWSLNEYATWLAHYKEETDYNKDYLIWQFTDKGTVDGIKNAVDLNFYYNK